MTPNATYRGATLAYPLTHGESHGDYDTMYGVVDVRGATVIDVGADEGSTADYFFQKGAARVVASELDAELVARLRVWASEEPRLLVVGAMVGAGDLEAWIADARPRCRGGRLVVKVDADLTNDVPGGAEEKLLDMAPEWLGEPDAWVIETHSPAVHVELCDRLETVGYAVRLVRQWRCNPNVKVIVAERGS